MLKINKFYIVTVICLGLILSSCNNIDDQLEKHPIQFTSTVSDPIPETRVATFGIMTLAKLRSSADGFAVQTNGIGSEMNGVIVKYSGGVWSYTGNYYWPINKNQPVSFTAYAPAGITGATLSSIGLAINNYIPPISTTGQVDIVYAPPANYTRAGGNVILNFNHILTQIVFSVRTNIPSSKSPKIVSIELFVPKSKGDFNGTTWTVVNPGVTYTVFSNNTISNSAITSSPIVVIPQAVTAGITAKVTIKTNTSATPTSSTIDLSTATGVTSWSANTKVTYNIFCTSTTFPVSAIVEDRNSWHDLITSYDN